MLNGHESRAYVKICSSSSVMMTSPNEWKILEWDDKPITNKQTNNKLSGSHDSQSWWIKRTWEEDGLTWRTLSWAAAIQGLHQYPWRAMGETKSLSVGLGTVTFRSDNTVPLSRRWKSDRGQGNPQVQTKNKLWGIRYRGDNCAVHPEKIQFFVQYEVMWSGVPV